MAAQEIHEIVAILTREARIVLSGRVEKISPDLSLAVVGFDSLGFVELLVSVERHFGVKLMELGLSPEDLKTLTTLARRIQQVT